MSQFLEFEGKNMDKALEKASNELKTPIENLEYDVVSYGSSGIFGLVGAKKAKIRIKPKNKKLKDQQTIKQAKALVKDAFNIKEQKTDQEQKISQKTKKLVVNDTITQENIVNAISVGETVLQRFADYITIGAHVVTETSEQRIIFKIEGGNSGLLIGKRGQTLEAMQYLLEKIVNKQNDQRIRVLVDVEEYLQTRKANLQKMATRMADKAKKRKKPVTIGQMNAYDRRTVHLHLKSNNDVRTQSVGEGYYRKLIIFPKRKHRRRNNRSNN